MNSSVNIPKNNTKKEEIYELQVMLRTIAQIERRFPVLNPDGIYGSETTGVVRAFQEQNGLTVTGVVDFETWRRILAEYQIALNRNAPGIAIFPFPGADHVVHAGEKSDLVLIIQIMLSSIAVAYDDFENLPLSGIFGTETVSAVRRFQAINRLPETGDVNKATWDELAKSYNLFAENDLYTE